MLPDEETTKVNQCVANILQYWRNGEADKLTQLVLSLIHILSQGGHYHRGL